MFYLSVIIMCKCTLYSISTKPNSMHCDILPWKKMADVTTNEADEVSDTDSSCGKLVNFVTKF